MACPRCGTVLDGRFCHACGFDAQAPVYVCPRCGGGFTGYACPFCGLPLGSVAYFPAPAEGTGLRAVGSVVWSMALLLFLILLAAELVTLAYTVGLVIDGSMAGGPWPIDLYILVPFPFGFSYDAPAAVFLVYYLFLIAAIVAGYVYYAFKDGRLTLKTFVRPIAELGPRLESRSGFLTTGQVFLAVLLFQGIYLLALELAGFVPEVPTFSGPIPDWYPYYALTNASVYEEIVTRWMFIGLPLFLGAALLVRSEAAFATTRGKNPTPMWRHLIGGTITRDSSPTLIVLSAILVVLSSAIFGLAHVPSWGWWKFLPTFVAGIALGYLFLRCGLLAAILFHFATDYLAAMAFLTEASLGAQILLALLILVLMALGILFFAWYFVYAAKLVTHFASVWRGKPLPVIAATPPTLLASPSYAPAPPPPTLPAYGSGFAAFACARCNWREARYEDGRFTCLRCGQVT